MKFAHNEAYLTSLKPYAVHNIAGVLALGCEEQFRSPHSKMVKFGKLIIRINILYSLNSTSVVR